MHGGQFRVRLLSPGSVSQQSKHSDELAEIADEWECWPPSSATGKVRRIPLLASYLPLAVASDRSAAAQQLVGRALSKRPALVVFDFLHSVVLAPTELAVPSVLFTHNVEAEIVERQLRHATQWWKKLVWRNQLSKMQRFERQAMRQFDRVVAVSERDGERFKKDYAAARVDVIPTGVNLEYFNYVPTESNDRVVFTGSMDWLANADAIRWFKAEIWPRVKALRPAATMTVVGRNPPADLLQAASPDWIVTGRVDDVRPYVQRAAAYVIPLRIGGGTRIKAFEAMAMGVPVISTSIGMEGLDVKAGVDFLQADCAEEFARSVAALLSQVEMGRAMAERARRHVEQDASNASVARTFERICERAVNDARQKETAGDRGGTVDRSAD